MIPLTYIALNLIHALWHAYLIKKNRLIQSGQKVIEYSIASLLAGLTITILSGWELVPLILFCVLCRLAFFAPTLNILRGGFDNIFYESKTSNAKKWTFDWFQYKIGWPLWVFFSLYWAAFIIYLIIYLV